MIQYGDGFPVLLLVIAYLLMFDIYLSWRLSPGRRRGKPTKGEDHTCPDTHGSTHRNTHVRTDSPGDVQRVPGSR